MPVKSGIARTTDEMAFGVLGLRRARHEQELLKDLADQGVLAEHAERGGIRARDVAFAVGEDDAVGERDECLREGRLIERRILAPPAGDAAALALALLFVHVGILKRTRVP